MGMIQTVLAFVFALGVLIFVHEYGHFWVARRCGVKVLRFSIGFGRPLFSHTDKHGTEFTVSGIPLGGYVRMLDEREGEVPPELLAATFNRQSVWKRIAIVAAGPFVNLAFAVFLYWIMFMAGVVTVVPIVGEVRNDSPAHIAGILSGQEIVSVDGNEALSWEDVTFALVRRIGESGEITIGLKSPNATMTDEHVVVVENWMMDEELEDPLKLLGIKPVIPVLDAVLGELMPDGAAKKAGLSEGDKILAAGNKAIETWSQLVEIIKTSPGTAIQFEVERDQNVITIPVTPDSVRLDNGQTIGRIGARVAMPEEPGLENQRIIRYNPIAAIPAAINKMWDRSILTLESVGKMLRGLISVDNISGPITIAKVAGQTASYGPQAFFSFMAYISVSLGILNLLPIPVLDGGHLLYYLVELVKGSPVSETFQTKAARIGMALLLAFMMLAILNDIARL